MVSSEALLIKFSLQRTNYYTINKFVSSFEIDKEYKILFNVIDSYYNKYTDRENITTDEVKSYFDLLHPKIKDRGVYLEIINNLNTVDINDTLLKDVVNRFIEKSYANKIISKLTPVLYEQKFGLLLDVEQDLDAYKAFSGECADEIEFVSCELGEILKDDEEVGLEWRLACLNHDIGPLRGESLGHIFARVDCGKTTFLVSEVSHMLTQCAPDEYILWFHNEEGGRRVMSRIYCAVLGINKTQLIQERTRAEHWFKKKGGDRIKMFERPVIFIEDIQYVLKIMGAAKCKLIVVDIGDKLQFKGANKAANSVEKLTMLYGRLRQLAKDQRVPILTSGQAGGEAEGKKFMKLSWMYASKTGKPGELDFAIGLGRSALLEEENLRFISICKNKLHNGVHGKHTVQIDTTKAIFTDF